MDDRCKCQTATATPAEPGDLLLGVSGLAAAVSHECCQWRARRRTAAASSRSRNCPERSRASRTQGSRPGPDMGNSRKRSQVALILAISRDAAGSESHLSEAS